MPILKKTKDYIIKLLDGNKVVPRGLYELDKYFRLNGPINFQFTKKEDCIVGVSTNYIYGSIVTSGKNPEELDRHIKDAILTSFEVPSSYAKEAKIIKVGQKQEEYALA